ncbi:MAG: hypothetical protein ACLGI8_08515 [Acidimicrobiia bacterium]|jgi:hypothetical protein
MQPRAGTSALVALLLVATLAACGGDQERSTEDIQADIAEQLAEDGLDDEAADCVAGVIVDEIGAEELQDVDFSAEEPPADLREDISAATLAAIDECDLGADGEP